MTRIIRRNRKQLEGERERALRWAGIDYVWFVNMFIAPGRRREAVVWLQEHNFWDVADVYDNTTWLLEGDQ